MGCHKKGRRFPLWCAVEKWRFEKRRGRPTDAEVESPSPAPHQPDADSFVDGGSGIAIDFTLISIYSEGKAALFKQ